jgi:2-polyprenyl-3-methyl-5-hydroxy-6-metoxy-1,4-benzoquinol methylase
MTVTQTPIDEARIHAFAGQVLTDHAAAASSALVYVGRRLGLYQSLADGPATAEQLAQRTGTDTRYVREWLLNQVASQYVEHDADTGTYALPVEHAAVLGDPSSPAYLAGAVDLIGAAWSAVDRAVDSFHSGAGIGWHEQDAKLFSGCQELFRPGYDAALTSEWIPALTGMSARLTAGAVVADVGCGHGASTIAMARAYPHSTFVGFDYHAASVDVARRRAAEAGVNDRVTFEVADAAAFPGPVDSDGYDLVTFFDCLHDLGDPLGAARNAGRQLAPGGTLMVVEPAAGDDLSAAVGNPVARTYSAYSTLVCVPNSLSQSPGTALGAQAGQAALTALLHEAGFSHVRRAADTAVNMVLEVRA